MDALSAVIQMVLLSLPYTLHSPTGTRHSIHPTPRTVAATPALQLPLGGNLTAPRGLEGAGDC